MRVLSKAIAAVVFIFSLGLFFAASNLAQGQAQAPQPECATQTFEWSGARRLYILCAPKASPNRPMAVLLGFHGGGGRADGWRTTTGFHLSPQGRENVTIYMQGCVPAAASNDCTDPNGRYTWEVGKPGQPTGGRDDHGYVEAVLDRLENVHRLKIDRARIYATGHSLGGIYSYSLMCDRPGLLAAIGPISAPPTDETCKPDGRTAIFHVHGTLDANVPFDTGCCSKPQQTLGDPAFRKACEARPLCANPVNWWPPVRSGDHPQAKVMGLDRIVETMGCSATWDKVRTVGATTCYAFPGCSNGTEAQVCLVTGVEHSLRDLLGQFEIPGYLWTRFLSHRMENPAQ